MCWFLATVGHSGGKREHRAPNFERQGGAPLKISQYMLKILIYCIMQIVCSGKLFAD